MLTYIEMDDMEIVKREKVIETLDHEYENSKVEMQEIKQEMAMRYQTIVDLENEIHDIDENLRLKALDEERRRLEEEARLRNLPKPKQRYIPLKGDKVDEKMATYINDFDLDIPFHRVGEG